jgi:hypothetical protein
MNLIRFLSYPVFYDPASTRAVAYVMEHFFAIRSRTRSRRLLKFLVRPVISRIGKRGREQLENHPKFDRLRPYLEVNTEVVIDARRFFRVIDFDRRQVVNILKCDELSTFFDNEMAARTRLTGSDFIPRLASVDESNKVFIEEYICQRPFKSGSLRGLAPEVFIGRLKGIIRQVHNSAPVRVVKAEDYVRDLVGAILSRPEADEEIQCYIRRLGERATGLKKLELVYSHGDFRPDQLFFARDGSIKIIDWENSGYFSLYRDLTGFFINEKWLCDNPAVSLESFLDVDRCRLKAFCYLYLLELAAVSVRIGQPSLLPGSIPTLKEVERRLEKLVRECVG